MIIGRHILKDERSGIRFNERSEIGASFPLFLFPLSPWSATRMLFSNENLSLVLMWLTTSEYFSWRLSAISSASLLWNFVASGPIPPVVEKISGVKEPLSTCMILWLYAFFFSFDCSKVPFSRGCYLHSSATENFLCRSKFVSIFHYKDSFRRFWKVSELWTLLIQYVPPFLTTALKRL